MWLCILGVLLFTKVVGGLLLICWVVCFVLEVYIWEFEDNASASLNRLPLHIAVDIQHR